LDETAMSVVITRHREDPNMVEECLRSLADQDGITLEVLLLDQAGDPRLEKIVKHMHATSVHAFRYLEVETQSLSRSRNIGTRSSSCRYIAFTDPDCRVHPGWALSLVRALREPQAAIAGGKILPRWEGKVRWWHRSTLVREMAAILDLGEERREVTRVFGCNFCLDRELIVDPDPFDEKMGRTHGKLLGGEETDLCLRAVSSGWKVLYVPGAVVTHLIPRERMTLRDNFRRAYYGGHTRALRGGMPSALHPHRRWEDFAAAVLLLPPYAIGYLGAMLTLTKDRPARRGSTTRPRRSS
jgi:GT2 family glycosyltransferase